jgi:hypothetical protein
MSRTPWTMLRICGHARTRWTTRTASPSTKTRDDSPSRSFATTAATPPGRRPGLDERECCEWECWV